LTTQVQDDGFHEIQLNGKQLVFLFMAATVVSVVIFLFGVLVGRGVKSDRAVPAENVAGTVIPESTTPPGPAGASIPVDSDPTKAAPPPAVDDGGLSYFNRLEKANPPEDLKPVPERPAAQAPARTAHAPTPAAAPVAAVPRPAAPIAAVPKAAAPRQEAAVAPAPAVDGYAIQVAALREPGEADTIAKRLVSKGYGAYVLTPPDGTPNVYRVRIGKFKTRREAEAIASKLQKEEQFKPWITR
jgi:septal ring-binding cell division protein DamX